MSGSISLRISGEAGQGLQLVSDLVGHLLARSGRHVFGLQDVMSRIRGGHNFARLRAASEPISAPADRDDLLVALKSGFEAVHLSELAENGLALADEGDGNGADPRVVRLPFARLATESGGSARMANAVALGAVAVVFDLALDGLAELLREHLRGRDGEVVRRNTACLEAGMRAADQLGLRGRVRLPEPGAGPLLYLTGSTALALGSIAANVRVIAGYPMSPGTPVLEYCGRVAEEAGLVVEMVEDEVAAINLALGASFAGARAMTATSGGGFSLMNEGLSLSGMTETPVVVMLGMRPGPATGMATHTAQADLFTALYAGHGEFGRVVLAPSDAAAAFDCARRAFELAERYQVPAIVLFDQLLGDGAWTAERLEPVVPVSRVSASSAEPYSYRRYALGPDGVSERLFPGTPDQLVYADSDEHTEEGHITESAEVRLKMVSKRAAKTAALLRDAVLPVPWPGPAQTLVCCFGSTKGTVAEAVARLRHSGADVAMLHFEWVWPFPGDAVRAMAQGCRVITVENNATGQLARLLAQESLVNCAGTVLRYDGRPFRVDDVREGIAALMEGRS